ncbi:MAG: retropepsin-like aspartic protease family protein [Hyphomicrobiales bacterium]
MLAWFGLIILLLCGGALVFADDPAAYLGLAEGRFADIARGAALSVIVGVAFLTSTRERGGPVFQQAAVWVAIVITAGAAYSYRTELIGAGQRLAGGVQPTATVAAQDESYDRETDRRTVAIRANQGGQFDVDTLINGTHVSMIADTGATLVTLTHEDARRIGIDVNGLDYTVKLRTANGITHGALIDVDEIEVGGILVRQVPVIVSQPDVLHRSLLGMSYLRQVKAEFADDQLILRE